MTMDEARKELIEEGRYYGIESALNGHVDYALGRFLAAISAFEQAVREDERKPKENACPGGYECTCKGF